MIEETEINKNRFTIKNKLNLQLSSDQLSE
jgi:hypothetical protein